MLALPWVRPNDLHRYIDIGVRKFKVALLDVIPNIVVCPVIYRIDISYLVLYPGDKL